MPQQSNALSGRVFNWTFNDGPTAGKTYEHTFAPDGTVKFKEAGAAPSGGQSDAPMPGSKYAAFEIAPNTYLVSYLSSHGYTLTVAMNLDSKQVHGFASGNNEWHPLEGTVQIVK
jgi:hypothetical protein